MAIALGRQNARSPVHEMQSALTCVLARLVSSRLHLAMLLPAAPQAFTRSPTSQHPHAGGKNDA